MVDPRLVTPQLPRRQDLAAGDRLAASFLLVVLVVGSIFLWIGVPATGLWLASQITQTSDEHFVVSLALILPGLALFAVFLFWVNGLYIRVVAGPIAEAGLEPDEEPQPVRGPLEAMMGVTFVIAVVAMTIWFFFFAENPSSQFF